MLKKAYLFGMLAALCLTFSSLTSAAAASEKPSSEVEQHCVTHLQRTTGGATEVAARSCATSQEAAYENLPVRVRQEAMSTKLLAVYQNAGWTGSSDSYTGEAPCDTSGYYIVTSYADISFGISSYRTYNNCNGSRTYYWGNEFDWCADGIGDVYYVGDECNDHLWSMRVYRAF